MTTQTAINTNIMSKKMVSGTSPETKKRRGNERYIPSYYLDLDLSRKKIHSLFLIHINGKKYGFGKSNSWLSEKVSCKKRYIKRIIKELEDNGFITREFIKKNKRTIFSELAGRKPMGSIPEFYIELMIRQSEFKVLSIIHILSRKGPFRARNSWLVTKLNLTEMTVKRALKKLTDRGFITRKMVKNRRVITLNEDKIWEFYLNQTKETNKKIHQNHSKNCAQEGAKMYPLEGPGCTHDGGLDVPPIREKEKSKETKRSNLKVTSLLSKKEREKESRFLRSSDSARKRAVRNRLRDSSASTSFDLEVKTKKENKKNSLNSDVGSLLSPKGGAKRCLRTTSSSCSLKEKVRRNGINYKIKNKKEPFVPKKVQGLLDFWNSSGLRKHKNKKTKIYARTLASLKSLLNGTFFDNIKPYEHLKGKKFSEKEFLDAVTRFRLAALDPTFDPIDPNIKRSLAKFSICDFLFNPRTNKSWFVECLERTPRLHIIPYKRNDEHPRMTKQLKDIYVQNVLGGVVPNNGASETMNRKFVMAAKMLNDFFESNSGKINQRFLSGDREHAMCSLLWESLIDDIGDPKKITPGHFSSEYTFAHRLPAYLNSQNIINSTKHPEHGTMNIYKFNP